LEEAMVTQSLDEAISVPRHFTNELGARKCFIRIRKQSKAPIDKGWGQSTGPIYSLDDPTMQEWLNEGGNYGVLTGSEFVVVDCDSPEIAQALEERLPPTLMVRSPGSKQPHFYYAIISEDGETLKALKKTVLEVDGTHYGEVQASGQYVVGPGSIHPKGGRYELMNKEPIHAISYYQLQEALREWWDVDKRIREDVERARHENAGIDIQITKVIDVKRLKNRRKEWWGSHPIHGSDTGQNFWVNPEKNVWHCFRHRTGGSTLSLLAIKNGLLTCRDYAAHGLRGEMFMKTMDLAVKRGYVTKDQLPRHQDQWEQYFQERGFVPPLLGDELMQNYRFITLSDTKEIYVFRDNIHQRNGDIVIRSECARLLGEAYRKNRANEVVDYIQAKTYRERKEPPIHLVPVQNGVYNLNTKKLEPFDPEHFWTFKIPIHYDAKATPKKIVEFIKSITESTEDAQTLAQFAGYCLYRGYPIHKALILLGHGANGKSTYISLLEAFLGKTNCSQHGIHEICNDSNRFVIGDLYQKLLNCHADIPDKKLFNSGRFKMLTGGDTVIAEKKFHDSFSFNNYAKFVFSANWLPATTDKSYAYHRRIRLISFPNIFSGESCDPHILDKLTTPEELSGFFNLALDALNDLLREKDFRGAKPVDEARERYEQLSDSIAYFVESKLEKGDENDAIPKDEFYNHFTEFCEKENTKLIAKKQFYDNLGKYIPHTISRRRIRRSSKYCVVGIRFQDKEAVTKVTKNQGFFN
jgi:putative DNA primase/helicase